MSTTTTEASLPDAGGIIVQYKGMHARVVPGETISIVVDGTDAPLTVPVAELVFER